MIPRAHQKKSVTILLMYVDEDVEVKFYSLYE